MNKIRLKNSILKSLTSRQRAVLFCLAVGMTVSETARQLSISRTTIYRLLNDQDFNRGLIQEQRNIAKLDLIFRHCASYRRRILQILINVSGRSRDGGKLLQQFKYKLEDYESRGEIINEDIFSLMLIERRSHPQMKPHLRRMIKSRQRQNWEIKKKADELYEMGVEKCVEPHCTESKSGNC